MVVHWRWLLGHRWKLMHTSPLSSETPSAWPCASPMLAATVSVGSYVSRSCCVSKAHKAPLASSIPTGSYNFSYPPQQISPAPWGEDVMETSHWGLAVPKSLTLCTMSSGGCLYFLHLLHKKASPTPSPSYSWGQSNSLDSSKNASLAQPSEAKLHAGLNTSISWSLGQGAVWVELLPSERSSLILPDRGVYRLVRQGRWVQNRSQTNISA